MNTYDSIQNYSGDLLPFTPFPKATERSFYEALPTPVKEEIIKEGETYLGFRYPSIQATDFMRFKREGNRVLYEDVYFQRRHALCALAVAECVEHNGRFMDDLINGIFVICEESAWQLPAHNTYIRDTPALLLPDSTAPILDLFACETGALLACLSYLLKEELDAFDSCINHRINSELQKRILTPYLSTHFWWMGRGEEPMCNWTVWCTQNILLTVFLGDYTDSDRRTVLHKAAGSCDYFLKDYGEDGCCDEGAQYYRHAGLCLANAYYIMNEVCPHALDSLFTSPKIKNIAKYILNVHVEDKYYINFADCSAVAGRCTVREYLFGKWTHQEELCSFAAKDYARGGASLYTDEVNQINLFYRMQTLANREEILRHQIHPYQTDPVYYESVGLFVVRNNSFTLAVKAGDNNDSHNHNDCGSITLYKNGSPLLVDIGVESYTQKTFSDRRYEIWTMQSGYHNLPTIEGFDELPGETHKADNVLVDITSSNPSIRMDLIHAYPSELSENGISYHRKVSIDQRSQSILLEDDTNASNAVLNLISYEKPTLTQVSESDHSGQIQIGNLSTLSFTGAKLLCIETLPITDPRLQKAWDHDLYRIRLCVPTYISTEETIQKDNLKKELPKAAPSTNQIRIKIQ